MEKLRTLKKIAEFAMKCEKNGVHLFYSYAPHVEWLTIYVYEYGYFDIDIDITSKVPEITYYKRVYFREKSPALQLDIIIREIKDKYYGQPKVLG